MTFAVLISGSGSNLQAMIDAKSRAEIASDIAVVLSNKQDAYGLERARQAGIKAEYVDPSAFSSREEYDQELLRLLAQYEVDFVVLAGYMRILSEAFVQAYEGRLLNIHPSLLPDFKGAHAIRDAYEAGVAKTGATVHFVVSELDAGPIIIQDAISIDEGDTLDDVAQKIHQVEHVIYPQAIQLFEQGRLSIHDGKVKITP